MVSVSEMVVGPIYRRVFLFIYPLTFVSTNFVYIRANRVINRLISLRIVNSSSVLSSIISGCLKNMWALYISVFENINYITVVIYLGYL